MEIDSTEMHSDDGKANLEKNRKRTLKTRAQVQALEKFYDDHKYPTEDMKLQLAESIGLTEKQVSGWFCHRRLKDKRLMHGENYATGRQDRSSGVIQDHGSGHRQDSCGSTKQGNETREVESGRLSAKELLPADITRVIPNIHCTKNYTHSDDPSSGSSSSLRNMPHHHNVDPFNTATGKCVIPKFPADLKGLKPRAGPSGYLKVKGRVENAAITAVKSQLGKHYREDGPPLGIEFDPLPPGAFESAMLDPIEEACYAGGAIFLPPGDATTKIHQDAKFVKGYDHNSGLLSYNTGTGFKIRHEYNTSDGCINQNFRPRATLSSGGVCYPEVPDNHVPVSHSRGGFGLKPRQGFEVTRINSTLAPPLLQTYSGKLKDYRFCKFDDVGREILKENTENENSKLPMKRKECHSSEDAPVPRHTLKQHLKTSSLMDKLATMRSGREMERGSSEDEVSAETS